MSDVAKPGILDMYTGVTKGPAAPVEMGTRTPGSFLTQLSPDEQRLWDNLFNLFYAMRPFIDYLGGLNELERPPWFIEEPWHFVTDNVSMHWPNYQAMYDEYREAGFRLMEEYERLKGEAPNLGIEPVTIGFLVVVVSVGGAILLKFGGDFITSIKKDPQTLRIEAETRRMEAYGTAARDFAARGQDFNKHLEELHERDKTVAEDAGISWPYAIKEITGLVKWLVIGGVVFLGWKIVS